MEPNTTVRGRGFAIAIALTMLLPGAFLAGPASASAGGDARAAILAAHLAHPADLHLALESDAGLRGSYVAAHLTLAQESQTLPAGDPERAAIYAFYRDLIHDSLGVAAHAYFERGRQYDPGASPALAFLRERALRTLKDALELTPARRSEIADVANFQGAHRRLLETYGILLMDNARLSARQEQVLEGLLAAVPAGLHDLGAIGFVELLGAFPAEIGWWDFFGGSGGEINSFAPEPGTVLENPFPAEVQPSQADIFLSALAHETTHIIDAYTVTASVALSQRRDQLLAAADCEPLNYLRSTLPACFFTSAPQEFLASIANQWFIDSAKVLALGLARFDAGRRQPLEQFVYFADLLAQGSTATWLYRSDPDGSLTAASAALHRDAAQRIDRVLVDGVEYRFSRDQVGNIVSYSTDLPPCAADEQTICLQDGRFELRTRAWDHGSPRGQFDASFGPPIGDISFVASFFSPENKEQLGKVLDGCGLNGHYWFFMASTTDVEFETRVRDTRSGRVRIYHNADAQRAPALTDVEAFACNPTPGSDTGQVDEIELVDTGARFLVDSSAATPSPCASGATAACLQQGRFEIRTHAWDHANPRHEFEAEFGPSIGDVSFVASFFSSENKEQLGKVIDACSLNGHFWFFMASTTDVEFETTVRDSLSGQTRTYSNLDLQQAPALTDIEAFSCN